MKVKVGDRIYDGEEQPVMVILDDSDKENIKNMDPKCKKYCSYPAKERWTGNNFERIKKWMEECHGQCKKEA